MMAHYIPFPPQAVLSGNGHVAAAIVGGTVHLVNTRDGSAEAVPLAHEAELVAVDPEAKTFAVAGGGQLSLLTCIPGPRLLATAALPMRLYRLVMGRGGLVAGIASSDDMAASLLFAWRGEELRAALAGNWESLGPVAIDGLHLDGVRRRALYWGLRARQVVLQEGEPAYVAFDEAFQGDGEPFVNLAGLEDGGLQVSWTGQGAPPEPNGFLLPLEDGRLGAYSRDTLVVLASGDEPGGVWRPVARHDWGDLETLAAAPSGTHLAWVFTTWDGEQDTYHVRVASLSGQLLDEATLDDEPADLPVLAVDDAGVATLVYVDSGPTIVALTLEGGRMNERARVGLPTSSTR